MGDMSFGEILCFAVILDAVFGDPQQIIHPVRVIGSVINFWYNRLFDSSRSFMRGLVLCTVTLSLTGFSVWLMLYVSGCNVLVKIYLLYSALAWRDLKDETLPVLQCLMNGDIVGARESLSRVVGRDTERLSENGICCAVIETIAENSVDGVMSVLFFAGLGQVINAEYGACVGVWVFKAVSTLDSMVGYESLGRYGTASARLDDAMNFLPARLGGLVIVLAGLLMGKNGLRVFLRDRLKHRSPNSGHGESGFAAVLGVRLGGGAEYGGEFEARDYLNGEGREAEMGDIVCAWKVLDVTCSLFVVITILSQAIISQIW